jgi:hypothetical protein
MVVVVAYTVVVVVVAQVGQILVLPLLGLFL